MKVLHSKGPENTCKLAEGKAAQVGFAGGWCITTTAQKCGRALHCPVLGHTEGLSSEQCSDPSVCLGLFLAVMGSHSVAAHQLSASRQLLTRAHGSCLQEGRDEFAVF